MMTLFFFPFLKDVVYHWEPPLQSRCHTQCTNRSHQVKVPNALSGLYEIRKAQEIFWIAEKDSVLPSQREYRPEKNEGIPP